jgi:hypothetical protein
MKPVDASIFIEASFAAGEHRVLVIVRRDQPGFFTGRTAAHRVASHDFGLPQFRDLLSVEAELSKHLLGLLPKFGGPRHHLARGS